jgi:protein-disulfide isomerase
MRRILLMSVSALSMGLGTALAAGPVPPVGPEDQVIGDANAPVTVIEYASLTCPHCGRWEKDVFPKVRSDFVEKGKVRFVFRDFPLDALALKAAQLAHCTGDQRFWGFLEVEFGNQASWVTKPDPTGELIKLVRMGGLSEDRARACMSDDKLAESITLSQAGGSEAGVNSTPTFFINGKSYNGEIPYDEFAKDLKDAGAGP